MDEITAERLRELADHLAGEAEHPIPMWKLEEPITVALRQAADRIEAQNAEVEELTAALAWVGDVYPATGRRDEGRPALVSMTWDEFNRMRLASGLRPVKPSPAARLLGKRSGE